MEEEKTCTNCRYFIQHYANGSSKIKFIHSVECGHCINNNFKYNSHQKYPFVSCCNLWEPIEIQIAERRQGVLATLLKMSKNLEQIIELLKLDDKD